jgi:myo-inositol-1(or 4)-monophosphatase
MYQDLLKFAIKTAKIAGKYVLAEQKKGLIIEEKGKNDLVTNADRASEEIIIKEIKKKYPSHAIIGEESSFIQKTDFNDYANAEYIWLVDPIDGTTNYAHQLKEYAVSIGLFKISKKEKSKNFQYLTGELIVGVVYAPGMNELFSAAKGEGANMNGKKIHVSKINEVKNALFATGFPYKNQGVNLPYFNAMMGRCQAIRRLGAASLDLCYVAAGRFEGYWEFGLKPWDIAAGALIIEEAVGRVTDTNGNQIDLFGADIFASNTKIHKETLDIFDKI